MDFNTWFDTFLEEKGIELSETFEVMGESGLNFMAYQNVVDKIKDLTNTGASHEQAQIKDMLVKIDFHNGDVRHYFRHLAGAIAI